MTTTLREALAILSFAVSACSVSACSSAPALLDAGTPTPDAVASDASPADDSSPADDASVATDSATRDDSGDDDASATSDTDTSCGDGSPDSGEECDDDNRTRWDGCDADCRVERSMVLHDTAFAGRAIGCDYSGDGLADNRFAEALGSGLPLLSMLLVGGGGSPSPVLLSYVGLDDATGFDDDELSVAWLSVEDADMDATNDYSGSGPFYVQASALTAAGDPSTSIEASIVARALDGGPADLELGMGLVSLELREARLRGTTMAVAGELHALTEAQICGVVTLHSLSALDEPMVESLGMGGFTIDIPPACDGTTQPSTMVDWLVGGGAIAVIRIRPTAPDVDLDGDGLETFELTGSPPGAAGCQPVITACIDGDGTRIDGRDCDEDPRIADGYSAALTTEAIRALVVGVR